MTALDAGEDEPTVLMHGAGPPAGAPVRELDELELLEPVIRSGLGPIIESLDAAGSPPGEIVEVLQREHHVAFDPRAVRRYVLHLRIVRKMHGKPGTVAHSLLDGAIRDRAEELREAAGEDLRRYDGAIKFLDDVVQGREEALGQPARVEIHEGRPVAYDGVTANVKLTQRIKAAVGMGALITAKYTELLKRPIVADQEASATEKLEVVLAEVYGPSAKVLRQREPKQLGGTGS